VADSMFNQQEVQILLGGINSPVDLEDLRKHTNYGGLYDDSEATITAFWNVRVPNWRLSELVSNEETLRLLIHLIKNNEGRY
jgi:hypothetical protein